MKFTKIFDLSDESPMPQNQQEDYDTPMHDDDQQDIIQHDLEVLHPESKEMMGDWTCAEIKVDEINSNEDDRPDMSPTDSTSSMDSFYKPEADQSEHEQSLSEHVTNAFRRDTKDHAAGNEWAQPQKLFSSYLSYQLFKLIIIRWLSFI